MTIVKGENQPWVDCHESREKYSEVFLFEDGDKTAATAVLTSAPGGRHSAAARTYWCPRSATTAAGRAWGNLSREFLGLAADDMEGALHQ